MIRDGTISKDKLSFEILETNENGGIDIGMIYNGDGGRFGEDWATFTQMTQTALDKLDLVAPQIELSGPNIFIDSDGTIEPESVTITAKLENGTEIDQWLLNGKQNTSYVSEDGLSITIPSGEVASKNIATVQVLATNGLYDTMSIYKLSDSATGQDAYSVIIDNENILISTDQESRTLYHQSFGSQINVYHNLEKTMEYTINE